MPIMLSETFRAVFYTPFYAAHALEAYAAEGLDVRLAPGTDPALASQNVLAGSSDVAWGGPMRIFRLHDKDPQCPLVAFCEVVTRDPFFLVGREANPGFRLRDLEHLKLATVSEVPTPWLCLQEDIRRAGVDPESIERVTDQTMAENVAALRAGDVDVIQIFQPFVETLVADGTGHILLAAASRGETTYTALATTRRMIAEQPDILLKMTRAIYRMQKWLHASDAPAIAETVAGFFPDLDRAILTGAIARYKKLELWGRDPLLPVTGFVRLKNGMLSAGDITRDVPYDECVDPSFARQVIAENPPAIA